MPSKKNSADAATSGNDSVPAFTEYEVRFVKAIFDSMNQRPDVDFDKVASIMSLANAKGAKDRFRNISKKHGWSSTDGTGGAAAGPAKPKGALATKSAGKVAKKTSAPQKKAPSKKGAAKAKKKNTDSDVDEDVSANLESDSDGKTLPKDAPMESEESEEE